MSQKPVGKSRWARREFLGLGLVALAGCTSPLIRAQSPEVEDVTADEENGSITLVGDYCGGWGLEFKKLQAIALVTNLDDTGSDPAPGVARDMLIGEMQGRNVKDPQKVLASPKVSLVELVTVLPPAVQKGDPLDVMVKIPARSTTTSLRGGWLMPARLREMAAAEGTVHTGKEAGLAEGNIAIDAIFEGTGDPLSEVRGRILGGGVSLETRTLGLVIRRDDVSIETTSVIGVAVNQRFHTFDRGTKKGVAEPRDSKFVTLLVPARYRQNLGRYVAVVRSIPLREAPFQRAKRLTALEQKLFEPTTSAKASLQLEAIGKEAIPVLKKGLKSRDLETRFHAAEGLAYLDEPESAKTLGEAAREEQAFRWSALTALSSMDHVQAYEALNELLHVNSAQTRYGAFRALRRRRAGDPLVAGEVLGRQFSLHLIPSTGEPMIHISKAERSEIVLFGQDIAFRSPQGIFAGKQIMLTSTDPEQIKLSRFTPGQQDRVAYAGPTVEQVIRAIVSLGGTYGDVIQALQEAKQTGLIDARLEVDAVPRTGIAYYRDDEGGRNDAQDAALDRLAATDAPGDEEAANQKDESYVDPKYTPGTKKGVWSKLTGWFSGSE